MDIFLAAANDPAELARLLRAGYRVDVTDGDGWTPLFYAAGREGGDWEAMRLLLEAGADPNHRSTKGESVVDVLHRGTTSGSDVQRAQENEELLRRHGYREPSLRWKAGEHRIDLRVRSSELVWRQSRGHRGWWPEEVQEDDELRAVGALYAVPPEHEGAIEAGVGWFAPGEGSDWARHVRLAVHRRDDAEFLRLAMGESRHERQPGDPTARELAARGGWDDAAELLEEPERGITAEVARAAFGVGKPPRRARVRPGPPSPPPPPPPPEVVWGEARVHDGGWSFLDPSGHRFLRVEVERCMGEKDVRVEFWRPGWHFPSEVLTDPDLDELVFYGDGTNLSAAFEPRHLQAPNAVTLRAALSGRHFRVVQA
ncbi:MAG: ankyrin repeat domain-containing protein [Planctomycetota bacterium]